MKDAGGLLIVALVLAVTVAHAEGLSLVAAVVDGDTVTLGNGAKVRYLGINAPEQGQPFFREALELNRKLVQDKRVRLELDAEQKDRYGRLLAYVFVGDEMVNLRLLREGLAHVLVIPPNLRHSDAFLRAQREARAAHRGIWGRLTGPFKITTLHADAEGDDRLNLNGEYLRVANLEERPMNLRGFRISDRYGHTYIFRSVILPPGHTLLLFSGSGRDLLDSGGQVKLYWNSDWPIWNNEGDTAFLRDPEGRLVDSFEYRPRWSGAEARERGRVP
jgi:micrococcal nuclease